MSVYGPRSIARTGRLSLAALAALVACGCSGTGAPAGNGDPSTPPAAATWSKSLGGPGDDWANAVIATRDGGYLFAGVLNHQELAGTDSAQPVEGDMWVTKLDTLGDVQWQQAIGERRSASADTAVDYRRVRAGVDGYWMVGTQASAGPSGDNAARDARVDLIVARLNDDGSVRWTQSYDSGPFGNDPFFESNETARDRGWDIAPTADGGALVVAWSSATLRVDASSGIPAAAPWIVRLNAMGQVVWQRRLTETQFDYIADDPAELLVRESADRGAIVAASARIRGSDTDPAVQLSLLNSDGALRWTRRYSRLLANDLLQVEEDEDGVADDDIVIGGTDFGVRLTGGSSVDDQDTIVMKFHLEDGDEDWRVVIDEGVSMRAVTQICKPTLAVARSCYYIAAGSGRRDDAGETLAMANFISETGTALPSVFFDGLAVATDVQVGPGNPPTASTPLVMIGFTKPAAADDGRTFRLLLTPTLEVVDREITTWTNEASSLTFDELTLQPEIRSVASAQSASGIVVRVFGLDDSPLLSREYGGASERRGERAFDALEVSDGFVVVGQADGTSADPYRPATLVAKLDASGGVRWQVALDDLALITPYQTPYEALAESGDGGMVIVGAQGRAADAADFIRAVRLDGNGVVQWTSVPLNKSARFGGSGFGAIGFPYATSVQRANDGGYFVAGGTSFDGEHDSSAWVTGIDAQGALRWQRELPHGLRLTSARALGDGGVVVAGVTTGDETHVPWAARLASDGALRWIESYAAGAADSTPVARIAVASNGGFLIAASHLVTSGFDSAAAQVTAGRRNVVLIRLDDAGAARWHRTYGGLFNETLYGLDTTADGGFVVAGRSDSLGERGEAWIMRLGADGLVNAGCNALRTAEIATNYAAITGALRTFVGTGRMEEMTAGSAASRSASFPTAAPRDTVLARQCSGVSQPDNPGTPQPRFELTLVQGSPSSPGVVTSAPAGISCGTGSNICNASYAPNTTVTLRIDPGAQRSFQGWQGCDAATADQCLVTMDRDRSVTATFEAPDAPRLSVAVTGNGAVSGGGLNCRSGGVGTCAATYAPGAIVTLSAAPDATETFLGWGGACADFLRATPIDVEMNARRDCTAMFTGAPAGSPRVTITLLPALVAPVVGYVRSTPNGLACGSVASDCSQTFAAGTTVRLEGISIDANFDFETFRCTGQLDTPGARIVEFVVTRDVDCTATFDSNIERLGVRLAVDLFAASPGRVIAEPANGARSLDCTADCDRPFTRDTQVTLRAVAQFNYVFSAWSGCDSETGDPLGGPVPVCNVFMSRTRNVVAFFTAEHIGQDTLRVLAISFPFDSGAGTVQANRPAGLPPCTPDGGPCERAYDIGEVVLLTIQPAGNNTLIFNEGCETFTPASGSDPATCGVVMDRDRGVTFAFNNINAAPVAVITSDPAGFAAVNQTIAFSAELTTDDEDVRTLLYYWDFDDDGVNDASGITASHAFAAAGSYRVRLIVIDRAGSLDIEYAFIDVSVMNTPPTASFIYSPASAQAGAPVTFDASGSSDNGSITTYRWDFDGDGGVDAVGDAATGRIRQWTYAVAGTYIARLTVIDDTGRTGETTRNLIVTSLAGSSDLTLNITGSGFGVVEYIPVVYACSKEGTTQCVRQFAAGLTVTMIATAYSGSVLGNWTGCGAVSADRRECTVAMDGNRTVSLQIN